jgi:hypothetical protein
MNPTRRALPALLLLPGVALAQAPAQGGARRGPNGGLVTVADGHPLELLVTGTDATLFLNGEDGRPSPSARANGRLTIQAGGQTSTVTLRPAEPNRLVGTRPAPLAAGARVVFNGAMSDGHRVTARYVIE